MAEMPDPEEFMNFLEEMMKKFMSGDFQSESGCPKSDDPEDFPRRAKIEDDINDLHPIMFLIDELNAKRKKLHILAGQCQEAWHDEQRAKQRLFNRLEERYPDVYHAEGSGTKYGRWKGDYYYLGYDRPERSLRKKRGESEP